MGILNRIGFVVAKKWIGGITIDEVIGEAKRINGMNEKVVINYLGEELKDRSKIAKNVKTYLDLLAQMKARRVKGDIAIKPTQLGLDIGYEIFLQNYTKIIKSAKSLGIFVWLDMEDHQFVDDTIKAYLQMLKVQNNIGLCLQSKLRRTLQDLHNVVPRGGIVRLVKGAYANSGNITYNSKHEIDSNYMDCMRYLFISSKRFMLGTHDDKMIDQALIYQKKYNKKAMFGMLKGIRANLSSKMARTQSMYIYLPFGEDWKEYSIRRLKEREHSMLILRSIFQG